MTKKIIGDDKDSAKRQDLIRRQWLEFSKKAAFKEFMDYIAFQDALAIAGAKGPINTFEGANGEEIDFDPVKSSSLLQRSVGYDIVKLYVEGYTNPETL